MMLAGTLSLSACGDDNNEPNKPDTPEQPDQPINPDKPSTGQAMSPTSQKERMDAIAQEFMRLSPASDFKSYSDLGNYMYNTYSDYNWDEVGDWAKNCWESARKETGKTEGKTE